MSMTKEQEEAVERLSLKSITSSSLELNDYPNMICLKKDIIEVLSMLEKKDKIIDEMAEYLALIRDCPNENCGANLDCENRCRVGDDIYPECWKIYFERKVEE